MLVNLNNYQLIFIFTDEDKDMILNNDHNLFSQMRIKTSMTVSAEIMIISENSVFPWQCTTFSSVSRNKEPAFTAITSTFLNPFLEKSKFNGKCNK